MSQSSSGQSKSLLLWLDYKQHMLGTLQDIYDAQQYTDCRLVVPDGELYANRPILSMASGLFEAIFTSMAGTMDPSTILIPDMTLSNLVRVVQFIYTGRVTLHSNDVVPFMEACSLLQLRGVECCGNRTMGIYIDETSHSNNTQTCTVPMAANHDSLGTALKSDPLDISLENELKQHFNQPHQLPSLNFESVSLESIESNRDTNEIFLMDICKGELFLSDESAAEPESSDTDADCLVEDSTVVTKIEVINERSKTRNYTPYQNCLKRALLAIIEGGVLNRVAATRYNIPTNKLVLWTEKVKREMRNQSTTTNVRETIAAVIDGSIQQFKSVLEASDENAREKLLCKDSKTLAHDLRFMLAIHEIIHNGMGTHEAIALLNTSKSQLHRRLYNLSSSRHTKRFRRRRNDSLGMIMREKDPELYEAHMADALKAINSGTLSLKEASFQYRVPISALGYKTKMEYFSMKQKRKQSATKTDESGGSYPMRNSDIVPKLAPITNAASSSVDNMDRTSGEIGVTPSSQLVRAATVTSLAAPSFIALPKLVPISISAIPGYEERMLAAIDAIKNQKMSYREASLKYNIAKTALWRMISKKNEKL
uniref:BTB domain-containing protein n=1 Tax=Anopheles christyi TaxID=43041 RepID=A0A182KBF0_9DIPT